MVEILTVQALKTHFSTKQGGVYAVNGVSFRLREGESLAIVGKSGSGKSATFLSLLGLLPDTGKVVAGRATFRGQDLLKLSEKELTKIRGAQISLVSPSAVVLNPARTIVAHVAEPLETHFGVQRQQSRKRAADMLAVVGFPADYLNSFPHQLSTDLLQRVMIAAALICTPQILIIDLPANLLDESIVARIIRLRQELSMSLIWIAPDIRATANLADRVAVMHAGLIVEEANLPLLLAQPQHPLTIALNRTQSDSQSSETEFPALDLSAEPESCPYAARCSYVIDRCRLENPPLTPVGPDHLAACWVDVNTGTERY